jgi:short-chain fatty acids transporter
MISWVTGLSSSIPLLLNTPDNYLIEEGILTETIASENTLGSAMNFGMIATLLILGPLFMWLLAPKKKSDPLQLSDMLGTDQEDTMSLKEEALEARLPFKALSDILNNSVLLQYTIATMGAVFLGYYFMTKGFDLNLNIMIFVFIVLGLYLHRTPMRFTIAMRRASSNVSAIIFQFPFYAGIMGIMTYTGLGEHLGQVMAEAATIDTYPYYAFVLGGIVNFAIPSAGGEFAVIGPSVIEAIQQLGQGLPPEALLEMTSRASMAIAYGEALTNCLQPFFLLLIIPVMAKGIRIQARDVMGYLVIPFLVFFLVQGILVGWLPL